MNKVILVGRLTKDPEIRVTQSGKKVASFAIAVDDGKDSNGNRITQYFNCSAWDSLAGIIESYVKKGHRVAAVGRLQNRSWDKPDGTKGYATDISVRELEMLTSRAEAEQIAANPSPSTSSNNNQQNSSNGNDVQGGGSNKDEEEDLPEIDIDNINVQMPF
jgi:single-strand DNA-binding protein